LGGLGRRRGRYGDAWRGGRVGGKGGSRLLRCYHSYFEAEERKGVERMRGGATGAEVRGESSRGLCGRLIQKASSGNKPKSGKRPLLENPKFRLTLSEATVYTAEMKDNEKEEKFK
jgi:hypothetical protein